MHVKKKLFQNIRRPQGVLGTFIIEKMNEDHGPLFDFVFSHLDCSHIRNGLDLGCGGGLILERMLQNQVKHVTGLDYSRLCIERSLKHNQRAVESGVCNVVQGDVIQMPFGNEAFDLVSAIETVSFWPDIALAFSEVHRVLAPKGLFCICNESDGTDDPSVQQSSLSDGFRTYTEEELRTLLKQSGFTNIRVFRKDFTHWLMLLAEKK